MGQEVEILSNAYLWSYPEYFQKPHWKISRVPRNIQAKLTDMQMEAKDPFTPHS